MGNAFRKLQGKESIRILMVGLDAAGKTTALHKLKLGEVTTTVPTIGFNVELVEYKEVSFVSWDVGGRDKIRPLWRRYYEMYEKMDCLVFVVDSNDRDRIVDAKEALDGMMVEDQLRDTVLLVFANKQDLPNAMPVADITEKLGLHNLRHTTWYIQGSVATSGEGLYEGLDWLRSAIQAKRKGDHARQLEGDNHLETKGRAAIASTFWNSSIMSSKFWTSLL
eukprot:CAMPEP_0117563106 /NCGR_PEP_ID=MMETSP0784-20121206/55319_1 /TAXON_ID=39447 /ORGANISM="" /LENGTH=221 /DNA_ID=CAMNT_0005360733 /DNA_START=11 /DNA_END=676 /DNA_ORIENTATION=+